MEFKTIIKLKFKTIIKSLEVIESWIDMKVIHLFLLLIAILLISLKVIVKYLSILIQLGMKEVDRLEGEITKLKEDK